MYVPSMKRETASMYVVQCSDILLLSAMYSGSILIRSTSGTEGLVAFWDIALGRGFEERFGVEDGPPTDMVAIVAYGVMREADGRRVEDEQTLQMFGGNSQAVCIAREISSRYTSLPRALCDAYDECARAAAMRFGEDG